MGSLVVDLKSVVSTEFSPVLDPSRTSRNEPGSNVRAVEGAHTVGQDSVMIHEVGEEGTAYMESL